MNDPIVLVHGLFHGLTHLGERPPPGPNRLVVLDLLGYRGYASTPEPMGVRRQAHHLFSELNRLGIERAHLVGHSVGGAICLVAALGHPERVASVVSVEGNFTPADAFWSGAIARMNPEAVSALLEGYRNDVRGWLAGAGVTATPERIEWTRRMFEDQPAATLHAVARSIVEVTSRPEYLEDVRLLLDGGLTLHLMAGERSRAGWNVPDFVLERAAGLTIQPGAGHMMPLEQPDEFLALIYDAVSRERPRPQVDASTPHR